MSEYRALTSQEIQQLKSQGCSAADWKGVQVADGFDPARVVAVQFGGSIKLGSTAGEVTSGKGVKKPCGLYNAFLVDCTVGAGVRIANVNVHIANYAIGDGCCIENVGVIETTPGATFGNGVEVEVLNEGGGREVTLYNEISSQIAYLMCVHRYRVKLVAKLIELAKGYADKVRSDTGTIGAGAKLTSVKEMINVCVGPAAVLDGPAALVNGTILSSPEAPTLVGSEVQAEGFIIAEGAKVTGGAILGKSFVGQGSQMGKQYSAENSLFFANCETFHGEACSVFGGPYTVTHHKSTLLIAAMFSFYNAGSGTNQSNHMYKLGPVHEGKVDRGSKTGSFSYMMWPCRVGPFSVVLGKHKGTFDTAQYPFSMIDATPEGKANLIPGMNLSTVGTVRDGAKWPSRDRRKGSVKRDRIIFDVFSPYTVGKMIQACDILKDIQDNTDRAVETVHINGAEVKRVLLRTGQKFYKAGIHGYLLEKVVARVEKRLAEGAKTPAEWFATSPDSVMCDRWIDLGGQLMPKCRLDRLDQAVADGSLATFEAIDAELDKIFRAYGEDEWTWVKQAYRQVFGKDLDAASPADVAAVGDALLDTKTKFLKLILVDAEKEFDALSRSGFGQDGVDEDADIDFEQVRGTYDKNKFVKQMREEIASLGERIARFKTQVGA